MSEYIDLMAALKASVEEAKRRREARSCGLCGEPATGLAAINDQRYCHGDHDPSPTCYERAQAEGDR